MRLKWMSWKLKKKKNYNKNYRQYFHTVGFFIFILEKIPPITVEADNNVTITVKHYLGSQQLYQTKVHNLTPGRWVLEDITVTGNYDVISIVDVTDPANPVNVTGDITVSTDKKYAVYYSPQTGTIESDFQMFDYQVNAGSDNNDGSEIAPLRTIQEAINRCPVITGMPDKDTSEMHYTIFVADGTYSESLRVVGKKMTIETSGTVILTALTVSSAGQVTLKGTFHFSNAGANCVTLYNSKLYCFGTIKVLAGSIGIILAEGSQIVCRSGIIDINNTTWSAIQLGDAGIGYIEELIGSGNTGAGIRCAKAIMWTATNTLATSGTPIIVADGGIVNTGTLNTADKTLYGAVNELHDRPVNNDILINSNFANPVNQRGYNGAVTTKSEYTLDRWKVNAGQSFVCGSNGIIFNASSSTCYFLQRVEAKNVEGKVVTFSSKINGKIYSLTANLSADATNENFAIDEKITMNISYTKGSESCTVSVVIKAGATPTIEWAKLEEGEHATPYVPRLYAEELQLCKRYYHTPYSPIGANGYLGGISENGQSIALVVEFPMEMRAIPTVTIKSPIDGSVGYVAEWTGMENVGNGAMIAGHVTSKQFFVTSATPKLTKGLAYYFLYEADAEL